MAPSRLWSRVAKVFPGCHQLAVVDNARTGLNPLITNYALDDGTNYCRAIDGHHRFMAGLAHDAGADLSFVRAWCMVGPA